MYERHYSSRQYRDGRRRKLFCGPGTKVVLHTYGYAACWVWREFRDRCIDERTGEPQEGINCAIFRNESPHLSSGLIRQADAIADCLWAHRRHYTYVNPQRVSSRNPGYCFLAAGWTRCGWTKGGLVVMERLR